MRLAREQIWLQRADQEETSVQRQIGLFEKAFAIEPKNFETAYRLGEDFRAQSWNGTTGYEASAQKAMQWFERSIALNPYYASSQLSYGMCLDWLGQTNEATPYFARAQQLDPNDYFNVARQGWHLFQLGDYIGAKKYFERSERLQPNAFSESFLDMIEQKLSEPNELK